MALFFWIGMVISAVQKKKAQNQQLVNQFSGSSKVGGSSGVAAGAVGELMKAQLADAEDTNEISDAQIRHNMENPPTQSQEDLLGFRSTPQGRASQGLDNDPAAALDFPSGAGQGTGVPSGMELEAQSTANSGFGFGGGDAGGGLGF